MEEINVLSQRKMAKGVDRFNDTSRDDVFNRNGADPKRVEIFTDQWMIERVFGIH